MKRFLMLVGVAVIAAAMYVAASPASQQAKTPTEKQFLALQKKVAALSKSLKTAKSEADASVGFISTCLVSQNAGALPVGQFGNSTTGFLFGTTTTFAPRTALDIDTATTPQGFLQVVDPSCIASGGLKHRLTHSGSGFQLARPERLRR